MVDAVEEEARALIAQHGARAHQAVVDAMVATIRSGDDSRLPEQARLLSAIEDLQRRERAASAPMRDAEPRTGR